MEYLHTMFRVLDLGAALDFWCNKLGLQELRRYDNEAGRYTLVFVAPSEDEKPIELTYNWDETEPYATGRFFGHVAFGVDNIYETCARLQEQGVVINRPPRDGRMAFVKSPDGQSVELLQKGAALPVEEPWANMPNEGSW